MRKIVVFVIALVGIALNQLNAQSFKYRFNIGVVGAQIHGDGEAGYNKVGLNLGSTIYVQSTETKSYNFEIAWVQKGSRSVDPPYDFNFRLNYIDFNGYLKNRLFNDIDFLLGVGVGYLLNARNFENTITDRYRRIDVHPLAGLGYSVTNSFDLYLTFYQGLYSASLVGFQANHFTRLTASFQL